MKYVPNALSIARIVLTSILLVLTLLNVLTAMELPFLIIYTIAGLTDTADGKIARRYNVTSKLGANLDGIADYYLVVVAFITIIPVLNFNAFSIGLVIGFIVLRVICVIVGYICFKQLMMMHTNLSRAGAMVAFLFPIALAIAQSIAPAIDENILLIFLGIYVYLFSFEEIAINIIMPEPKRNTKSVFEAIRIRKEHNEQPK